MRSWVQTKRMPATSEEGEEGLDVSRGTCALKVEDRWPAVPAGPREMLERGHLHSPSGCRLRWTGWAVCLSQKSRGFESRGASA